MHYFCESCSAPIGAITEPFTCQRTGRVSQPVAAVMRRTRVHRLALEERERRGNRAQKRRTRKPLPVANFDDHGDIEASGTP